MKKPDLTAIYSLLEPTVNSQNMELYDVEFLQEYGRSVLRLYIDKEGGITLDDCEKINYAVQPVLDDNDPIPASYILEVSSPGIERKLVKDTHFMANIGSKVEVKLTKPVAERENQKKFRGMLKTIEDSAVIIDSDGELRLPREHLVYCRLVYTQGENV